MPQLLRLLPFVVAALVAAAFFGVIAVTVLIGLAVLVPVVVLAGWLVLRFRPDLVRPKRDKTSTVIETTSYTVEKIDDGKPPRR